MTGRINIKILLDERMVGTQDEANMIRSLVEERDIIMENSGEKTELTWEVVSVKLMEGGIEWTGSVFNSHPMYLPSAAWTQKFNDLHDDPNTYVLIVFHPSNWKDPDHIIGGLNRFETGILNPRIGWTVRNWRHTIIHEMLHHFDNRAAKFPGVDFNAAVGTNKSGVVVNGWDWVVVHEDYNNQYAGFFNYLWSRIADEIAVIYPYPSYNGDMTNSLTWEEIEVLSWSVFGRAADEGMRGYVGQSLAFTLGEWDSSPEGLAKKSLLQAAQAFKPL